MHIALFSAYYPPHVGGVETVVKALAEHLAGRHRVTVITSAVGARPGVSREAGVEVHRLRAVDVMERRGVPYPVLAGPGVLRALAAVRSAEVCHAHGALYPTSVLAVRAAGRIRAPLVLTEHVGFVTYGRPILNSLQAMAWAAVGDRVVARSSRVTVVSGRVQAWLEARFPGTPLDHIPNGVDLGRFRPRDRQEAQSLRDAFELPRGETLVLFVGRAAEKKNLDAALAIPRDGFTLVVCGAPRKLALEKVINLGALPFEQMARLLGCVDVVLLPSRGEGFPVVAQEALASGLPLVVLWDEGYAGTLDRGVVAACAAEHELAPAVAHLVADPGLRAEAGRKGRRWASLHWGWAAAVAAYETTYERARGAFQSGRRSRG